MYMWVENLFNRVDRSRLLHEGPDRVAAEYVLRMGGTMTVEADGQRQLVKSMEELPTSSSMRVVEADLSGLTVTPVGAEHFQDLKRLEVLRLADCPLLADDVVGFAQTLPSLRQLDLSGSAVTPKAAAELSKVASLGRVTLQRMPGWTDADRRQVADALHVALPSCDVAV